MSEAVPATCDLAGLDAFANWLKSLPQEPRTIRFFDRKPGYSVHGEHAYTVARILHRSTAQVTEEALPSTTVAANLFPSLCKDLLVERGEYAVEVYEGSGTSWRRTKRGSPGLLRDFEAELARAGDMEESPIVASIAFNLIEGIRTTGLCLVDVTARRLFACEFVDDEQFGQLEMISLQRAVKEAVVPLGSLHSQSTGSNDDVTKASSVLSATDRSRLSDVLSRCGVLPSERPRALFGTKSLCQDLGRLLREGSEGLEVHRHVLDRPLASAALSGALGFAEVLADSDAHGRWTLEHLSMGTLMRVDAAAQRALNVFRSRADAADSFSLYGLLNRCKTAMGKRLLRSWLKQPLLDLKEISRRHDIVEAFVTDASLRADISGLHLRGLPDIDRLVRKLDRRAATLQDLCQLYRASARLPLIEEVLRNHTGRGAACLTVDFAEPFAAAHDADHLGKFENLVEAAVDLDRIPDEYLISASYDEGLEGLQIEKEETENDIQSLAKQAADDLGLILDKTIKLEWHKTANQRIRCLRITAKEERTARKKLQAKYMELETRKDGVKFTNRALKAAADRLQQLSGKYDALQAALVAQVVGVASTFTEVWERVAYILGELDVLCSFAEVAATAPTEYIRPVMLPADAGELVLKNCRHPCVEAQEGVHFIPNDVSMKRGESWFQLITGPNMGGKSTFIRQVGVCALMAQVGCFVPASEARISVRDAIFARVGAGDCQLRGVSTFMAEMLETAAILKGATASSLVIVDELGRGTSTSDGMGLAWAISEHLMSEIGAATMFATHFHELTTLQGAVGVKNLHVTSAIDANAGELTMLYQVREGSCDQSLGIHVAEFARFPVVVIEAAKDRAMALQGGASGSSGRKRKGSSSVLRALHDALLEFASMPFENLDEETAAGEVGRWATRMEQAMGMQGT